MATVAAMIPLTKPNLGPDEQAAALEVLASGMLVQGAKVQAFEEALAAATGHDHAVAVSSGTSALYLALAALGVGPSDLVYCPALTWPSPAHAALLLGARVRLVDVSPTDWTAGPAQYQAALDRDRSDNNARSFFIAIDQFGAPVDVAGIEAVVDGPLVLDAACNLGSEDGVQATRTRGVVACHSFHPRKVVTTGEGGAALTNDGALADELRMRRNHGQARPGHFVTAGHNFRLTDLGAAIGLAQLRRLEQTVAARSRIAARYRALLPANLRSQALRPGARWNAQTFGVLAPAGLRDAWIGRLAAEGVQGGVLSYALSQLPSLAADTVSCPEAEAIAARGVALPVYPAMKQEDVDRVVAAVEACAALGVSE